MKVKSSLISDIELIDSHCHLIFENFEKDLEDVVLRLRSKGIKKLVHACCELTEIPKLKKISHESVSYTHLTLPTNSLV